MTALKSSVKLKGLTPQITVALIIVSMLAEEMGVDAIVTSANDGKHMSTSKHYSGEAIDLRTKHLAPTDKSMFVDRVTANLGPEFDVIFEGAGTDNEHLHVEWDPK